MSDQTADRLALGLLGLLFALVLLVLSAFPSPEPALPRCQTASATIMRCQP